MVTFGVLGPLVAETGHGPVGLRGPRHRAVLARLLIARRRVVPVRRLVEDLWDDPPEGAVGAIQTFVAALRQAIEPNRPPRTPARLLVTEAPGYALRAAPDAVDAWRFESALTESNELLAAGRPEAALAGLEAALGLWRGPAYAEFADEHWARAEVTRLHELRLLGVERRAEAALALGRADAVVADLRAQVAEHPWREHAWRLLALALYRSGRQGDALDALRTARGVLVADLGLDPGPELRHLEADILAQAPRLDAPAARPVAPPPAPPAPAPPTRTGLLPAEPGPGVRGAPGEPGPGVPGGPGGALADRPRLFGRDAEYAELARAAAAVRTGRRLGLALLSGDAGAGKTALAEALATGLAAQGWTTAWGGNPEHEGAPAAWPWHRILAGLAERGHGPAPATAAPPAGSAEPATDSATDRATDHRSEPATDSATDRATDHRSEPATDPAAARFRMHRAVLSYLDGVAARGPLLLVLDDLHRAGEETLALLAALLAEPVTGPVLVLGTFRTTEISTGLAELLGRAARAEPSRVYLGGLPAEAVGELVHATTGRAVPEATARAIHERSGGNPFFVRELARLLDAQGDAALSAVPAGVRDVIRHRLAALPEATRTVLRQAAVLGRDVDLDLLIPLAGDEELVLDAVDSALLGGFLVESGPDRSRFAHALVRDALYEEVSQARRARWHGRIAETLEALRPGDVEALAHHFLLAPGRPAAAKAARYAAAAADRAQRRFAPHEAARLWRAALAAHDRAVPERTAPDGTAPDPTAEAAERTRLELVTGLVRALAVTGNLEQARRHRAEAITTAERLADPELTARVLGAFDVPGIWTANDDPALAARIVAVIRRTLAALGDGPSAERARLLGALAMELRGTRSAEGRAAAVEAEAIARRLGDPALLAFALNGRFMHAFERAGLAPRRAAIGTELVELAAAHELVAFEVLGHLVLLQARSALADFAAADAHAAAADRLARRYDIPLVGVFTDWYAALRLAVAGRTGPAEERYRSAATRLGGTGMWGLEPGLLPLALLAPRLRDGTVPGVDPDADWGPYRDWVRPLGRLAAGDRAGALAALAAIPESPHDLLREARACLVAVAAVALRDRPAMERGYAELLPAADELAGAGSGLLTLGPVAGHLARLAAGLGRPARAREHERQAAEVAERAARATPAIR
ncbi:BTAD domain-containing putative transcriptional regulator [Micromonospora sp. NPDC049559]|uniref:BTAD domain-containing putative transcriptional regulator n=1 Tax=Micromonospora sp. NPDC049559 TaxID=3155923 RepID=UPI00343CC902